MLPNVQSMAFVLPPSSVAIESVGSKLFTPRRFHGAPVYLHSSLQSYRDGE